MQLVLAMILLLILRTRMSIWLADVNGRVVKAIVNKDLPMFLKRVSLLSNLIASSRFSFFSFSPCRHRWLIRALIMWTRWWRWRLEIDWLDTSTHHIWKTCTTTKYVTWIIVLQTRTKDSQTIRKSGPTVCLVCISTQPHPSLILLCSVRNFQSLSAGKDLRWPSLGTSSQAS